jgi:hypothetical protein
MLPGFDPADCQPLVGVGLLSERDISCLTRLGGELADLLPQMIISHVDQLTGQVPPAEVVTCGCLPGSRTKVGDAIPYDLEIAEGFIAAEARRLAIELSLIRALRAVLPVGKAVRDVFSAEQIRGMRNRAAAALAARQS